MSTSASLPADERFALAAVEHFVLASLVLDGGVATIYAANFIDALRVLDARRPGLVTIAEGDPDPGERPFWTVAITDAGRAALKG